MNLRGTAHLLKEEGGEGRVLRVHLTPTRGDMSHGDASELLARPPERTEETLSCHINHTPASLGDQDGSELPPHDEVKSKARRLEKEMAKMIPRVTSENKGKIIR